MEDIRKVNWKMNTWLNKKIEQQNKDDFKPLLYIVITLIATMITCTLLMSFKASAINIQYGGYAGLNNGSRLLGLNGAINFQDGGAGKIETNGAMSSNIGLTSGLNLCVNDTIPAGSIISLNTKWAGVQSGNTFYPQVQITANSYDYSVINNSYGEYGSVTTLLYTDVAISGCGLWLVVSPVSATNWAVSALPINWVRLENSGGMTQGEKDQLFQELRNISGAGTNTSINTMNISLDVKAILDELKNQQQQAEKQTQEASEEGQQNADGSQTNNEGASQNVIGVIGNVIGALNTPAGNCSYNVDLGNLNLGNLNFCSGKPPEFAGLINMAGSIIIVYACYKVARTVFRIWLTMSVFAQGSGKGKTD